ncbi:MAG: MBL fold metallo-hydrolase [Dehalococcoidia bacterium]
MEIIPGIHQLKLPLKDNPLQFINAYLVEGTDGWVLIDTGWYDEESFDAFTAHLENIGVGPEEINLIICTHIHPDHFGLAGRLKESCQAELAVSEVAREMLNSIGTMGSSMFEDMNEWILANGAPDDYLTAFNEASSEALSLLVPAVPERGLKDGEVISTGIFDLEVVWTPGHCPGHICLYESSKRILFSGDHILPVTTPNISIHMEGIGDPLGDYLASIRRIQHLDMDLGLPAHEDIYTDLAGRVDELLAHHEVRKGEIIEALDSGPKTAFEISARITWMEGEMPWEEMLPIDKRIAVSEALAHLESLREEQRISKYQEGELYYYHLA